MRYVLAAALILHAFSLPAHGRDLGQYGGVDAATRAWVNGLKNDQGIGCCATLDGIPAQEVEWDAGADRYRVRIGGEWLDVPDGAVIREPNRLGYAVAWVGFIEGRPFVRCFIAGAGG